MHGTLVVILSLTISGYIFLSNYLGTKYQVSRHQGHHLVYKAVLHGTWIHILSASLFILFWSITSKSSLLYDATELVYPSMSQSVFNFVVIAAMSTLSAFVIAAVFNAYCLQKCLTERIIEKYLSQTQVTKLYLGSFKVIDLNALELISSWSFQFIVFIINLLSFNRLLNHVANKFGLDTLQLKNDLKLKLYVESTDSELISHFFDPRRHEHSVFLVTLTSRRCYVCIPLYLNPPIASHDHSEISIVPIYSGYRDKDDLCFERTTSYQEVLRIFQNQESNAPLMSTNYESDRSVLNRYRISIKFNDIVSIATFRPSKYRDFKEAENKRRIVIDTNRAHESLNFECRTISEPKTSY
ncbi:MULTISPECIES: hypothetical protein [Idiomarina]|uniref:hypothetical protein n=1 Tax=Idiomarina TaxID=135575 RepID=UPI00129D0459|nr:MULTISPECIES: hypothetical protein [Idiomarina]MRJ43212.1 hypothetical protein [Idiomarina sp. FeN1]NCU58728.1 hypothetical protein [Idiomarina sp. FenA--70]NCU61424.1 hypothetical protein [Idiomarina sp. FenBw--71]UUN12689.1 hypothetical protein KGF88_08475 [Idiomarina loihiensis]